MGWNQVAVGEEDPDQGDTEACDLSNLVAGAAFTDTEKGKKGIGSSGKKQEFCLWLIKFEMLFRHPCENRKRKLNTHI